MRHNRIMIGIAIMMIAIMPIGMLMSDDSDAVMEIGNAWGEGFTNTSDGTLFVLLQNGEPNEQEITIIVTENGTEIARATVTVPIGQYTAELRFRLSSLGDHDLTITCEPAEIFPTPPGEVPINSINITVTVGESLWSKPSTYIAIVVVALLIVIAFYLRMRSAPSVKPDTTFTELEKQQREASRGEEEDKIKASVTEKRRYKASNDSSKTQTKPPTVQNNEKKVSSFTELEKSKADKKATVQKKESSEEPKKIKYVSSRRK